LLCRGWYTITPWTSYHHEGFSSCTQHNFFYTQHMKWKTNFVLHSFTLKMWNTDSQSISPFTPFIHAYTIFPLKFSHPLLFNPCLIFISPWFIFINPLVFAIVPLLPSWVPLSPWVESIQPKPGSIIGPVWLLDWSCIWPNMTQPDPVSFVQTWWLDRFLKPKLGFRVKRNTKLSKRRRFEKT